MRFSIIYSIDTPRGVSVETYNPPKNQRKLFQLTERDDKQNEYCYLEGLWEKGKHRKLCGILNREQFDQFVEHTGLVAENVRTMGSLGAPGCGYGIAPAFSFTTNGIDDAILNAYVTPLASPAEVVSFLREVNEQYEGDDLPIPGILTDNPDQGYLFEEVPQQEAAVVEDSLREAFCAIWGK